MTKPLDILVLGAGVIGLTTALVLHRRGHRVRILAEKLSPDTTSDRAGAKFTPFGSGEPERERRWVSTSYAAFARLAQQASAANSLTPNDVDHGVRMAQAREYIEDLAHAKPWWSTWVANFQSFTPPADSGFKAGFEQTVPHMDVSLYIPWLARQCSRAGISIGQRAFASLTELQRERFDLAVNCTGLGASTLVPDPLMTPMRGQVLRVTNTTGLDMSLVADRPEPPANGSPTERGAITYIFAFPKHLILGGTFEPGIQDTTPNPKSVEAIVERCRTLAKLAGHAGWARLGEQREKVWAGLRPARLRPATADLQEDIRLELASLPDSRPVIHNYGHGRAGITLSWGCAEDVAGLAESSGMRHS